MDDSSAAIVTLGFENGRGGQALAYWKAADLMRETFEGTVSFLLPEETRKIRLIDLMTGDVFRLPDSMLGHEYYNTGYTEAVMLKNLPLTDSPLLLTFGDFAQEG